MMYWSLTLGCKWFVMETLTSFFCTPSTSSVGHMADAEVSQNRRLTNGRMKRVSLHAPPCQRATSSVLDVFTNSGSRDLELKNIVNVTIYGTCLVKKLSRHQFLYFSSYGCLIKMCTFYVRMFPN